MNKNSSIWKLKKLIYQLYKRTGKRIKSWIIESNGKDEHGFISDFSNIILNWWTETHSTWIWNNLTHLTNSRDGHLT